VDFTIVEPIPTNAPIVNILFIHSYMFSGKEWETYPLLMRTHARFILVDLYSHGTSSDLHPPVAEAREEDLTNAKDIISFMHENFKGTNSKYFVVGHSFGGRVGGLIAAQDPDNVLGAVLVAPVPVKGTPLAVHLAPTLVAAANDFEKFTLEITKMSAVPESRPRRLLLPHFMKAWFPDFNRAVSSNFAERAQSMAVDRSFLFEGIHCPLLFVAADQDFFLAQTVGEIGLFKNTFVNLHCFQNLGHWMPCDSAVELSQVLDAFIVANIK